jgi:hypothetical protein
METAQQKQDYTEIVNTIYQQIRCMDRWAFGAWGAKDFKRIGKSLHFAVNGAKFRRGYIEVEYDYGTDAYNVKTYRKYDNKVVYGKIVSGIYFDQLVKIIDRLIERGADVE